MKLYTEEQVREAARGDGWTDNVNEIVDRLTPIELPSDEDIKHCIGSVNYTEYDNGFIQGIKWMKEQILNQNKLLMKTAMQELLENLQKSFDEKTYPIRIDATYSLEKEKVQFHDMFAEGFVSAYQHFVNGKDFVKFEEYYNQTYNQNK